jgi:hypothetical protein
MPPALHIAVNSPRSNAIVDLTPVSDVLESWSLPWHALQRSLAQGSGVEMSGAASFRRALANAKFEPAESASWRLRACAVPGRRTRSSG